MNITNSIIEAFVPVAVQIVLAIVGIVFTLLLQQLQKTTGLRNVTAAVDLLRDAVINTVYANQQQLVESLKASSEDGKLTADEITMLQARTVAKVRESVGPAVIELITAAGIDANALIIDSADAVIAEIKGNN